MPGFQLCTLPAWTSHPTAGKSFYGSAFGKSNHYFISKLLILALSFPTFSAHLFINMNHHIFQHEFGWRADSHPFLSLLWNKLVFFGTITGKENQCLTFNSWVLSARNIRTPFQLFLFSNPASRIPHLDFFYNSWTLEKTSDLLLCEFVAFQHNSKFDGFECFEDTIS